MPFDPDRYAHHVAHFGLEDAANQELIHTVYRAMQDAVDRAWGDDPVQLAQQEKQRELASAGGDVIDLRAEEDLSQTFNDKKGTTKNA